MEQNPLPNVLIKLPERLAAFDPRISSYCGHISTGKGITLKTPKGSLFLYHSLIHKLINHPDSVTQDELEKVVLSFR